MNTPQAAQRLLDALAAALPYAPHRAEFDIVADAADDLRAALKREEEALATRVAGPRRRDAVAGPVDPPVRPCGRSEQMQTYEEWRKAYNSMPLMNEAMAKAAWNAAIAVERERCARIVETQDTYGDNVGFWFETLAAKIRA